MALIEHLPGALVTAWMLYRLALLAITEVRRPRA
jgi:hypothetical protein